MEASVRDIRDSYDARAPLENAWTIPAPWYVRRGASQSSSAEPFSPGPGSRSGAPTSSPSRAVRDRGAGRGADRRRARRGRRAPGLLQRLPPSRGVGDDRARREGPDSALPVPRLDVLARRRTEGDARFRRRPAPSTKGRTASSRSKRPSGRSSSSSGASPGGPSLEQSLGPLVGQFAKLGLDRFHFVERRRWTFECNWKVFVDNYLDGGATTCRTSTRACPPCSTTAATRSRRARTGACNGARSTIERGGRRGRRAQGRPRALLLDLAELHDQLGTRASWTRTSCVRWAPARPRSSSTFSSRTSRRPKRSRAIGRRSTSGNRVQDEDLAICDSVQRGLGSRAYRAGRLSVRREGGELLFHRLLAAQLKAGLGQA